MSPAPDLSGTIRTAAGTPAAAAVDGQSGTARPIGDLIKADQYLNNKAAIGNRRRGVRMDRLVTPGAGVYGPHMSSFDGAFFGGFV